MNAQVIETRQTTHLGQTITIYRIDDALHGTFWGWIVGKHIKPALFRHSDICQDDAKRHIDGRQR